jgi:starch-binding outer membrane protein, SusD/RagB family
MNTAYRNILKYTGIFLLGLVLTTSCEDYLNKAPEVNTTEDDVFSKWLTFQGFIEDMYQGVPDPTLGNSAEGNWNYADDGICGDQNMMCEYFAKGDYWRWMNGSWSAFYGTSSNNTNSGSKGKKGYWRNGWYTIRNANLAIENIDKFNGTQEEEDILLGQAYWFRAYFHYEILRSWGGIPFIDTVFAPTDPLALPRLPYREVAERINADFEEAAKRLPIDWEQTVVGAMTKDNNAGRLTKGAAYAFLGKNLLYEASPLMNYEVTGTYTYDQNILNRASTALYEVIKLKDAGTYAFETWANYKKNFYTLERVLPYGKEIVFTHPCYMNKRWNYGDHTLDEYGGWGTYLGPTENYVENFGMNNGLPINAAGSGYDPANPWVNRDPRFYYNIIKDGDRGIVNTVNLDTWYEFFMGGRHRKKQDSNTGYGYKKFIDITCNDYDNGWGTSRSYYFEVSEMRLADVYLMYAEAVNEVYGPTTVPAHIPGGITAAQAVNIVRHRVEVSPGVFLPDVDARYLNQADFREIIVQERAVELAFEGHRWWDLRRWHRSNLMQYREKYGLEYDKAKTYYRKVLYQTISFEDKHWWLPFPTDQVSLYPEFKQNPGW